MKRIACLLGLASAVLGLAMLAAGPAGAQDEPEEKEEVTIKGLMKVMHKGDAAALPTAKKAITADTPDWPAAEKAARKLARSSRALASLEPPQGEKEGFTKLADAYHATAKSLVESTKNQDLAASKEAVGKLGMSCMECHKDFKP